jgi:hypothetical protein
MSDEKSRLVSAFHEVEDDGDDFLVAKSEPHSHLTLVESDEERYVHSIPI